MGDIKRNTSLVPIEGELKKKHTEIQINEKLSHIAGLKQRLDDLENIEAKKLRFQIEVLEKEIGFLEGNAKTINVKEE